RPADRGAPDHHAAAVHLAAGAVLRGHPAQPRGGGDARRLHGLAALPARRRAAGPARALGRGHALLRLLLELLPLRPRSGERRHAAAARDRVQLHRAGLERLRRSHGGQHAHLAARAPAHRLRAALARARAHRRGGQVTAAAIRRAAWFRGEAVIDFTDDELREVAPGEVRLRVDVCALCGSDKRLLAGGSAVVPGHEIAGTVVATGEGTSLAVGTRCIVYI